MIIALVLGWSVGDLWYSRNDPVFAWSGGGQERMAIWRASDRDPTLANSSGQFVAFRGDKFVRDQELFEELSNAIASLSGTSSHFEEPFWYAEAPDSRLALYFKGRDISVLVRDKIGEWREFSIQKLRGRKDSRINIDGLKYEPGLFFSAAYGRWVIRWVEYQKGWRSAWFSPDGREFGVMGGYLLGWIDGDPLVRQPKSIDWRGRSYLTGPENEWRIEERAGFQIGGQVIFTGPNQTMYEARSVGSSLRFSEVGPTSFIPFTYSILPYRPNEPLQNPSE